MSVGDDTCVSDEDGFVVTCRMITLMKVINIFEHVAISECRIVLPFRFDDSCTGLTRNVGVVFDLTCLQSRYLLCERFQNSRVVDEWSH